MDFKIDAALVKKERQKRGWSQEQLAAASGMGIRTIQRIEASGTGSAESAKCLAAVFELSLEQLRKRETMQSRRRFWAAVAALCTATGGALVLMTQANAADVTMAIVLGSEVSGDSRMSIEVRSGQQADIKLEKDVRLLLMPIVQKDGLIVLAAEIYGWDGGHFKLAGKPRLLMRQGVETGLQVGLGNGRSVRLAITPKVS
jgi:hypothetical protein